MCEQEHCHHGVEPIRPESDEMTEHYTLRERIGAFLLFKTLNSGEALSMQAKMGAACKCGGAGCNTCIGFAAIGFTALKIGSGIFNRFRTETSQSTE